MSNVSFFLLRKVNGTITTTKRVFHSVGGIIPLLLKHYGIFIMKRLPIFLLLTSLVAFSCPVFAMDSKPSPESGHGKEHHTDESDESVVLERQPGLLSRLLGGALVGAFNFAKYKVDSTARDRLNTAIKSVEGGKLDKAVKENHLKILNGWLKEIEDPATSIKRRFYIAAYILAIWNEENYSEEETKKDPKNEDEDKDGSGSAAASDPLTEVD